MTPPQIIILAGSNGAGKSTLSRLPVLAGLPFLNADDIEIEMASGPFAAGRTLIARLDAAASQRSHFVVETTLSGKWLASHLIAFRALGYRIHTIFVWLSSDDLSVARVASRVEMGGHNIPEPTIRRRYKRGLRNFWHIYAPLSDTWDVYDNSTVFARLVAKKDTESGTMILIPEIWHAIQEQLRDE
jgi:predicted ABC-type ATPase